MKDMVGKQPYSLSQTLSACLTLFCRAVHAGLDEGMIADNNTTLREGELFKSMCKPLLHLLASKIKGGRKAKSKSCQ